MSVYSSNNSLVLATINSSLPAFSGNGVTYKDIAKMFLSSGWTSVAGNTYQEGVRLSDKFVVKYNIGHGYMYTFLNGINLYGFDGKKLKLIASRCFNCYVWNDRDVKDETVRLLSKFFEDQCRAHGCLPSDRGYITRIATQFVDEAIRRTEAIGNYALASSGSSTKMLR